MLVGRYWDGSSQRAWRVAKGYMKMLRISGLGLGTYADARRLNGRDGSQDDGLDGQGHGIDDQDEAYFQARSADKIFRKRVIDARE